MTHRDFRTMRANLTLALGVAVLSFGLATSAGAVDQNVVKNCMDDYFSYCSKHAPGSPELDSCMQSNWNNLSKQCTKALLDSGTAKRNAANNTGSGQKK